MKEYKTVFKEGIFEIVIEKSKFIGLAQHVESSEEAQLFIKKISMENQDATHNVWCYCLGENMNIQKFSDDGEPTGTAGLPMLEVLKKEGLTNTVVIVTRYFGGIKLGAGGLVRAYSKTASQAIKNSIIAEKKIFEPLEISFNYSLFGKVQNEIISMGLQSTSPVFFQDVKMTIFALPEESTKIQEALLNLSSGTIKIHVGEKELLNSVNGKLVI